MAIAASRCNYLCLIGAVSFMGSDSLLAYDTFIAQNAMHSFWIMLSYYTGQFFLVQGALRAYANIQSYEQNPVLMSPS